MSGELIVAIVAVAIAGGALFVAILSAQSARDQAVSAKESAQAANVQASSARDQVMAAREQVAAARDSAAAAERQNELSEQMQRDRAQPYVVADVRASSHSGHLLQVVVENRGNSVARDVRVSFDPPLQRRLGPDSGTFDGLDGGITFLPPGGSLSWHLGTSFSYFEDGQAPPPPSTVTVRCIGPFGEVEPLVYDLSLADFAGQAAEVDAGSLANVEKALQDLTKTVERWRTGR